MFVCILALGSFSFTSVLDLIDHCNLRACSCCTHSIPCVLGLLFFIIKVKLLISRLASKEHRLDAFIHSNKDLSRISLSLCTDAWFLFIYCLNLYTAYTSWVCGLFFDFNKSVTLIKIQIIVHSYMLVSHSCKKSLESLSIIFDERERERERERELLVWSKKSLESLFSYTWWRKFGCMEKPLGVIL